MGCFFNISDNCFYGGKGRALEETGGWEVEGWGWDKKRQPVMDCLRGWGVICTRFELVTSCLSSKRSKPTELADHVFSPFFSRESGCKSTTFFETDKIILKKNVYLHL